MTRRPRDAATADWASSLLAKPACSPGSVRLGRMSFATARCHGVHRSQRVCANQAKSLRLDVCLGSADDRDRAVSSEVGIKQREQVGLVAPACSGRPNKRARDLGPRPGAGHESQVSIFEHHADFGVARLVGEVGADEHRGVEIDNHGRSRSSAISLSTTGSIPLVAAMIRSRSARGQACCQASRPCWGQLACHRCCSSLRDHYGHRCAGFWLD